MKPTPLLTANEMQVADAATIAAGTPAETLMQRAATAVAHIVRAQYAPCKCVVMCGKGNNGGDGRIAADLLTNAGYNTRVFSPEEEYLPALKEADIIIDALLGTGLKNAVTGAYAKAINALSVSGKPIIAVDIPSGINASTGEVMGVAVKAAHTVTFASAKAGHYLLPGKAHTGKLHVMDIGITDETIAATNPNIFLNTPALWNLPEAELSDHKYARGAVLVQGGTLATTGAAKLSATAALKIGAGVSSIICNSETLPIYAALLSAVMTKPANNLEEFKALIDEPRVRALLIGPGAGGGEHTNERTRAILKSGKPCVLDADALQPEILPYMHEDTVITPHQGEFERLFPTIKHSHTAYGSSHTPPPVYGGDGGEALARVASPLCPHASGGNKLACVEQATSRFPGVLVYKGSDTVIAQAGKYIVINGNAPPGLATAGSGDVLAGMIVGLLAQSMEPFDAACAGVWLHGNAGSRLGKHFTAEDILENF